MKCKRCDLEASADHRAIDCISALRMHIRNLERQANATTERSLDFALYDNRLRDETVAILAKAGFVQKEAGLDREMERLICGRSLPESVFVEVGQKAILFVPRKHFVAITWVDPESHVHVELMTDKAHDLILEAERCLPRQIVTVTRDPRNLADKRSSKPSAREAGGGGVEK